VKMYAIPNCETVKKARTWLDSHHIAYEFHDYKKLGVDAATLKRWCQQFGYQQVLNQRGTTWRKLDEAVRTSMTETKALKLMQEQPSIIKRPLLDTGSRLVLGFDEAEYKQLLV
jgi:arsenate reductase (glutaredoxin)